MATIPELLDGHITLEVECLDRLYLNGYIGRLATGPELSMFMRNQLGKPVPSPVVLGTGVGEIPRGREDAGGTGRHTDSPVQTRRTERRHRQQLPQATTSAGCSCLYRGSPREGQDVQWEKGERMVRVRTGQVGLRQPLLLLHR